RLPYALLLRQYLYPWSSLACSYLAASAKNYVCDQEGTWPGRHRLDHDCLSISEPCILPSESNSCANAIARCGRRGGPDGPHYLNPGELTVDLCIRLLAVG